MTLWLPTFAPRCCHGRFRCDGGALWQTCSGALVLKFGAVAGWINTRIILLLLFYVVLLPVGLVMKVFGADPLRRKTDPTVQSYRIVRPFLTKGPDVKSDVFSGQSHFMFLSLEIHRGVPNPFQSKTRKAFCLHNDCAKCL